MGCGGAEIWPRRALVKAIARRVLFIAGFYFITLADQWQRLESPVETRA